MNNAATTTTTATLPATGTRHEHVYTAAGCRNQWAHDHDDAECYKLCPWTK